MENNLQKVKDAVGIRCANCLTCAHKSRDGDGNEPEYATSWDICDKFPHYANLKSFPFKNDQKCWEPEFWCSKFAHEIKTGDHEEVLGLIAKFMAAIDEAKIDVDNENEVMK